MTFDWVVGTGGIGRGEIFRLVGNATLGREESRSAVLTKYRDYCKLHIILSYTARLIGDKIPVYACGRVGADERGRELLREMESVGLRTDYVKTTADAPTMYSVCFLYENGEGGNITTCNDACSTVTEAELFESLDTVIRQHGPNGIVLGAPEVPLAVRLGFMKRAKRYGCFTVCSVLAGEAREFIDSKGAAYCDLIAVNSLEAAALGSGQSCEGVLRTQNSEIGIILTNGKRGCDVCFNGTTRHVDAIPVTAVSTAGAGDALLGGTIAGFAMGLPLSSEGTCSAVHLGTVCASFAVESPHTIPDSLPLQKLTARADLHGIKIRI